jgi:hypothetical protein
MRIVLLVALLFCFPVISLAQEESYAYGQVSDLKGLKKVLIDTGIDTKTRNSIIKDLEKSKLGVEIVDDEQTAEILLMFRALDQITDRERFLRGMLGSTPGEMPPNAGAGVVVALNCRGKDRIIHSFQDRQQSGWERKPVTNFVREFIKIYKKANDIK